MWPRTCISCAVIVSAPAPAAPHVPAVSLTTSLDSKAGLLNSKTPVLNSKAPVLDSKDPNASKTIPFKNVFDSLTLFDDLEQESGARQEGGAQAAVPSSSAKKQSPQESSSGTEEASVLPAPTTPPIPTPNLPKAALILEPLSHGVMPGAEEAPGKAPALQESAPNDQNYETSALIAKSEPALPAASLTHSSVPFPSAANIPARVTSAAPAVSAATDAIAPVTPPATGKAQVTAPPFAVQSSVAPKSAQQAGRPTSQVTGAPQLAAKPLAANSVPTPSKPVGLGPVEIKPIEQQAVQGEGIQRHAPQPTTAPRAVSSLTRTSMPMPAVRPSSTVVTSKPIATGASRIVATQRSSTAEATTSKTRELPVQPVTAPRSPLQTPAQPATSLLTPKPAQVDNNNPAVSIPPTAPIATTKLSKPAQLPSPANVPAALPDPTVSPVQTATPAPAPQADGSSTPPANSDSRNPTRSQADGRAASTVDSAPPSVPVAPVEKAPLTQLPAAHDGMDPASETPSKAPTPQPAGLAVTPAPKVPLLLQAENLAFAVRMLGPESSPEHSSLTPSKTAVTTSETPVTQSSVTPPQSSDSQQPTPDQSKTSSDAPRDAQPPAPAAERPDAGAQNPADLAGVKQPAEVTPHWNAATVLQAPEIGSMPGTPEPAEATHANLPLAAQEVHLLAPELPKTSATSEILLHLTGNDQSSAAIRVAERAGSVNVSVHASDPVLRESLRSNLGELSTQLNDQGWKADITKPAAVAAQSGSQQDSHEGGQRGSQQQSFGGDRQPQRDRRASGGQWQQELDQQTSGGDAHPGGNG